MSPKTRDVGAPFGRYLFVKSVINHINQRWIKVIMDFIHYLAPKSDIGSTLGKPNFTTSMLVPSKGSRSLIAHYL